MKKIIPLLLLLFLTGIAHADNWPTVFKDKKYSFEIDTSRIVRKAGIANFYLRERDGKKTITFNAEINCNTRQYRTLSIGNDPKSSMSLLVDPKGGWESPKQKDKQTVVNYVCSGAKK